MFRPVKLPKLILEMVRMLSRAIELMYKSRHPWRIISLFEIVGMNVSDTMLIYFFPTNQLTELPHQSTNENNANTITENVFALFWATKLMQKDHHPSRALSHSKSAVVTVRHVTCHLLFFDQWYYSLEKHHSLENCGHQRGKAPAFFLAIGLM